MLYYQNTLCFQRARPIINTLQWRICLVRKQYRPILEYNKSNSGVHFNVLWWVIWMMTNWIFHHYQHHWHTSLKYSVSVQLARNVTPLQNIKHTEIRKCQRINCINLIFLIGERETLVFFVHFHFNSIVVSPFTDHYYCYRC